MTDLRELHSAVVDDLAERDRWESKQRIYYEMRHTGIRRKNKPWPTAADSHIPISDTEIERFKPYFYGQIFTEDVSAEFTCGDNPQLKRIGSQLEKYFDNQLKHHSNFEGESFAWIDNMLQAGVAPVKVGWDVAKDQLMFEAIDPLNIVVPAHTVTFDDGLDRICHIQQFSKEAFQRNEWFDEKHRTDSGVKLLLEVPDEHNDKQQEKYRREGITWGKEMVVVWEIWERIDDPDFNWAVNWISPTHPEMKLHNTMLREILPFVDFPLEIKDKGYYASRGICERCMGDEITATRLHNDKLDAMTLYNRPMFYDKSGQLSNPRNFKLTPGSVYKGELGRIQFGQPPIDFDVEMSQINQRVERRIASPNFAIGDSKERTAKEVSEVSERNNANLDMRGRIFRLSLSRLYRIAWNVLKDNRRDVIFGIYQQAGIEPYTFNEQKHFELKPSGTSANWHRSIKFNKAVQMRGILGESPHVQMKALDKNVIVNYDASMVDELMAQSMAETQFDNMMAMIERQNPQQAEMLYQQFMQFLQQQMQAKEQAISRQSQVTNTPIEQVRQQMG